MPGNEWYHIGCQSILDSKLPRILSQVFSKWPGMKLWLVFKEHSQESRDLSFWCGECWCNEACGCKVLQKAAICHKLQQVMKCNKSFPKCWCIYVHKCRQECVDMYRHVSYVLILFPAVRFCIAGQPPPPMHIWSHVISKVLKSWSTFASACCSIFAKILFCFVFFSYSQLLCKP